MIRQPAPTLTSLPSRISTSLRVLQPLPWFSQCGKRTRL
jgi:hypothetical protein